MCVCMRIGINPRHTVGPRHMGARFILLHEIAITNSIMVYGIPKGVGLAP